MYKKKNIVRPFDDATSIEFFADKSFYDGGRILLYSYTRTPCVHGVQINKAKNQRVKRALQNKEPKIQENDKTALFIKGGRTSETVTQALKDLYLLKKPLSVMYKKKNIVRPFDDATSIEFFADKSDASLFMFGSHSKKRPHNIVLGRLFDFHILDMIELGIQNYKPLSAFSGTKCPTGTKPCILFAGEAFDQDLDHQRLKSLLLDFFRGPKTNSIRLSGIEHVWMFTANEGKVYARSCRMLLKKSGSKIPRVELDEIGPSLDFVVRRTKLASDDLYKRAVKQPKELKPKKRKNVSMDAFGTKHGKIHMQKLDLTKLQTRKMKGLKRKSSDGGESKTASEGGSETSPSKEKVPKKSSAKK